MPSATKAKVLRKRAKRYEVVRNCAITAACDRFFRSRGMTAQRENFNRRNTTEDQKPNPEGDRWKE